MPPLTSNWTPLPPRLGLMILVLASLGCGEPGPELDPGVFDLPVLAEISEEETWTRRGTERIDIGAPEARRHLLDGFWEAEVDPDHGSFAWGLGEESTLVFAVVAMRDLVVELRGAPASWREGPRQTVTVWINGHRVRRVSMEGGVETVSATLPKETLHTGWNELRLEYDWTRSPNQDDPASPDDRPLAVAWYDLAFRSMDGSALEVEPAPLIRKVSLVDHEVLTLRAGIETHAYVPLDSDSDLDSLWLTVDPLQVTRRGRWVDVRWTVDGPDGEISRQGRLEAGADGRAALHLSGLSELPVADRPSAVELSFTLRPASLRGVVHLHRPAVRASGVGTKPASKAAGKTAAQVPALDLPADPPPLVLLYVIDTLRADHLGSYGYPRDVSPHLDALARDGIVFEQAVAQSSWTRSSMASLVTGVVPTRHGVHGRNDALAPSATTLAEAFRDAGYDTAGWTANGNAGDHFGFGQGFDVFEVVPAAAPGDPAAADVVQAGAAAFLDRLSEESRRGLLLLHTMEPHAPYWPEAKSASTLDVALPKPAADESLRAIVAEVAERNSAPMPSSLRVGSVAYLQAIESQELDADPQLMDRLVDLYDAEIRTVDRHFGALMDELRQRGLYDEALILVTADHGEEFLDHGGVGHGRTLHGEQLRVPLLLKPPASWGVPGGHRVESLVRHVDVWPTLLDAIGRTNDSGCHPNLPCSAGEPEIGGGSSLWPRVARGQGKQRRSASYAHLALDRRGAESLRRGRFKLLCAGPLDAANPSPADPSQASGKDPEIRRRCSLYDLEADPGESTDLSDRLPVLMRSLLHGLDSYGGQGSLAETLLLDEETDAQLRELGYL